jgi:uncharacterized protein (TIGR03067 family)
MEKFNRLEQAAAWWHNDSLVLLSKSIERNSMKRIMTLPCAFICLMLLSAAGCSTPQQTASTSATPSASPNAQAVETQPKAGAPLADSAALQGTWTGKELSADSDDPCRLVVSGQNFEFHGADSNEWYKGTFTLREGSNLKVLVAAITECPVEKYVGKTDYAIYRLENGTLTLTAYEPGNPEVPAGFDAPETRRFVFKLK